MKKYLTLVWLLLSLSLMAENSNKLPADDLMAKIEAINQAQNKVMLKNSTMADVDALFDMYSDDFVYIHEVYGGEYSRSHLYNNTMKYLKSGGYNMTQNRYEIVKYIVGLNAVALQRKEHTGDIHLAVFEFNNGKVTKITEYWK